MSSEFTQYDVETGIKKGTQLAIDKVCIKAATQAKLLTPVDTGRLRGSIGYKTITSSSTNLQQTVKAFQGYIGTPLIYGIYQEFGTFKMAAQPFLRPAIAIIQGATLDKAMADALNSEINKSIRKKKYTRTYK